MRNVSYQGDHLTTISLYKIKIDIIKDNKLQLDSVELTLTMSEIYEDVL